jgi:hypothetical protein
MYATNCCCDRIQDGVLSCLELPDAEVGRAFIESEANMNRDDKAFTMKHRQVRERDQFVVSQVKGKVGSKKSECLPCPDTSVWSSGDGVATSPRSEPGLRVLRHA